MAALAQGALALLRGGGGGAAAAPPARSHAAGSSSSGASASASRASGTSVSCRASPFSRGSGSGGGGGGQGIAARRWPGGTRGRVVTNAGSPPKSGEAQQGAGEGAGGGRDGEGGKGGEAGGQAGGGSSLNAASMRRAFRAGDAIYKASSSNATPSEGAGSRGAAEEAAAASGTIGRGALKINQVLLIYQGRAMSNKALKTRRKDDRVAVRRNAIRIFERAMEVDPTEGRPYVAIGQLLRRLGDTDAARQCYQAGGLLRTTTRTR